MKKFYKNKILLNSLLYFLGQIGERMVITISIPLIITSIKPEEYGIYGLVISIVNIFPVILSLGFTSAIPRLYFDSLKKNNLYSIINFLTIISLLIIILSILLYSLNIKYNKIILITGLIISQNILISMFFGIMIAKEKAFINTIISSIGGSFFLGGIILLKILNSLNLIKLLFIFLIWKVIINIILLFFNINLYKFNISLKYIYKNLNFSIPFIIHTSSNWFLQLGNRWILNFLTNLEYVGVFTLYYQISNTLIWLSNSINMSLSPIIMKKSVLEGNKGIVKFHNKTFSIYFYLDIFGMIIILIIGFVYVKYFTSLVFRKYILIFPILLLSSFIRVLTLPLINIYQAKKNSIIMASNTIKASLINLLLNLLLIKYYNLFGAAIAAVLTQLFLFILYIYNLREMKINYKISSLKNIINNL